MPLAQSHDRAVGLPLGPDSLVWRYFADNRMALLGPRAAVLQNMLPALGQGVEDHSVWFAETLARLQRSIPPIFNTVYGSDEANAGLQVRDFHRSIKGKLPDGKPYSALNPDTYYWAHATFIEHVITATDTFIRRLGEAEKEQLFAESVTWFERYGVSAAGTPATYAEFTEYWDHALDERLVAHRTAAYGVGYVTKGWPRPKQVPAPLWFLLKRPLDALSAFITTGGMPARAREILGLPWDEHRERRYQRFAAVCRTLDPAYRRLPGKLRLHPIALRAFQREGRRA
ncbi:MAG: oxygenase MpaB family protein [Marmoricola sp.]